MLGMQHLCDMQVNMAWQKMQMKYTWQGSIRCKNQLVWVSGYNAMIIAKMKKNNNAEADYHVAYFVPLL